MQEKADAVLIKELHNDLGTLTEDAPAEVRLEPIAELQVVEKPVVKKPEATQAAILLARDGGLDLSEITGTGQDGKIKKSDVQTTLQVREKMAEAEKEVKEVRLNAIQYLPDSFGRYESIYHYARTIHPMGGLGEEIKSPQEIKDFIEQDFFAKGWELAFVEPLGFGPDGLAVLWIFGKLRESLQARHKEIWHIQRTLGSNIMEGQITGFGADTYLNSYLNEGWSVFCAKALTRGGSEVPMLWVLVR